MSNEAPLDGNCAGTTKLTKWLYARLGCRSQTFHALQHRYTFNADISRWNLSAVTDISWLFNDARAFSKTFPAGRFRVQHAASL